MDIENISTVSTVTDGKLQPSEASTNLSAATTNYNNNNTTTPTGESHMGIYGRVVVIRRTGQDGR
jgi:hypothetical protein